MKMNKQHSIQELCSILNNKFDLTSTNIQKISNTILNAPNTTFLLKKQEGYEDVDALFYDSLTEYIDNLNNNLNYNFRIDKSQFLVSEEFSFIGIEPKDGTYIASTDALHFNKQGAFLTVNLGEATFSTGKAVMETAANFKASVTMTLNIKNSEGKILETQEIIFNINESFDNLEPNKTYYRTIFNPNVYSFFVDLDSLDNTCVLECQFSMSNVQTTDEIKTFKPVYQGSIHGQLINPPLDTEYILSNE